MLSSKSKKKFKKKNVYKGKIHCSAYHYIIYTVQFDENDAESVNLYFQIV